MSAPARSLVPAGHVATRITLIICGLCAALGLRLSIGGADPAASIPAACAFAVAALGIACAAGWRPGPARLPAAAVGVIGGAVLVSVWLVSRPGAAPLHNAGVGVLVMWTPAVALVAIAEEALLRGALFTAISEWRGDLIAVAMTSVVFAALHLPLYGAQALAVDFAVGVLLGGLRMVSGGVAAPALAHVLADIAGGWLA
jgi:membrane protease YdiL (CAAX protease family)